MVRLLKSKKGASEIIKVILKFILYIILGAVILGILIAGTRYAVSKIVNSEMCDCLTGENCKEDVCNRCPACEWVENSCSCGSTA